MLLYVHVRVYVHRLKAPTKIFLGWIEPPISQLLVSLGQSSHYIMETSSAEDQLLQLMGEELLAGEWLGYHIKQK